MFTRSLRRLASPLAIGIALVGCGSAAASDTETTVAGNHATGSDQRSGGSTSGGDSEAGNCSVDAIYFAYDSDALDARSRDILQRDVQCLQARRARPSVTGMTDPRGTEEYNLALGDRRARIVSSYMNNLGVEPVQVHSVGEEMAGGEEEGGWARDRRAEIAAH